MVESITSFHIQALTFLTILVAATSWIIVFIKGGRRRVLKLAFLPILLWSVFGTLDILVTADAVHSNPLREANPLAREIFTSLYPWGPLVASFAWITLWLTVSHLLDIGIHPVNRGLNDIIQLTLYYSLALGHLFALSGWMGWSALYYVGFTFNQVTPALNHMVAGVFYMSWVAQALALSCLHLTVRKAFWGGIG